MSSARRLRRRRLPARAWALAPANLSEREIAAELLAATLRGGEAVAHLARSASGSSRSFRPARTCSRWLGQPTRSLVAFVA
jgi:hypothetical protein